MGIHVFFPPVFVTGGKWPFKEETYSAVQPHNTPSFAYCLKSYIRIPDYRKSENEVFLTSCSVKILLDAVL